MDVTKTWMHQETGNVHILTPTYPDRLPIRIF